MQVAKSINVPSRIKCMVVFFACAQEKALRLVTCEAGESPKTKAMNLRIDISTNIRVVEQL
jgi:hypothetical protein